MRAASRNSLATAYQAWESVCGSVDLLAAAGEFFEFEQALLSSDRLVIALTDLARSYEARVALLQKLTTHAMPAVQTVLAQMIQTRWSKPQDFSQAVIEIALVTVLRNAQNQDKLAELQDEILRLTQLLTRETDLRLAIRAANVPVEKRVELLDRLIGQHVRPELRILAAQAVRCHQPHYTTVTILRKAFDLAGKLRNSLVASVTCAISPNETQLTRLKEILESRYHKTINLHVALDPSILGGMRIVVGGDVFDGTVAHRLADLRSRFAK